MIRIDWNPVAHVGPILRVVLAVGSVESVVDVKAVAPMVDSSRTAEVSLVNRTEINDLPINGRRADTYVLEKSM